MLEGAASLRSKRSLELELDLYSTNLREWPPGAKLEGAEVSSHQPSPGQLACFEVATDAST